MTDLQKVCYIIHSEFQALTGQCSRASYLRLSHCRLPFVPATKEKCFRRVVRLQTDCTPSIKAAFRMSIRIHSCLLTTKFKQGDIKFKTNKPWACEKEGWLEPLEIKVSKWNLKCVMSLPLWWYLSCVDDLQVSFAQER